MRNLLGLAAVTMGAAVLLPGCGQQRPLATGVAATPLGTRAVAAACHVGQSATSVHTLNVSADDNLQSFCVRGGTTVLVYLKGTLKHKWAPIHVSSSVLKPSATPHLQLAPGVTGASFAAVHPGTAIITSVRPVCGSQPPGADASRPGAVQCEVILTFRVSVTVI